MYNNNNLLTYVLSSAKLNTTGLRWIGDLADFNFTIHYRPGKANIDADTLLRMALDDIAYMELCTEVIPHEVLQTVMCSAKLQEEGTVNWISALSGDPATLESDMSDGGKPSVLQLDVKQAQTADPVINRVRELIQCGLRPTTAKRKKESQGMCSCSFMNGIACQLTRMGYSNGAQEVVLKSSFQKNCAH